jgi:hypothetical protein
MLRDRIILEGLLNFTSPSSSLRWASTRSPRTDVASIIETIAFSCTHTYPRHSGVTQVVAEWSLGCGEESKTDGHGTGFQAGQTAKPRQGPACAVTPRKRTWPPSSYIVRLSLHESGRYRSMAVMAQGYFLQIRARNRRTSHIGLGLPGEHIRVIG